ncbi:hypothetical protein MNBD_GAMMA03-566 [hydrothermal vent metagenome]|uniref:Uncharacterized protein n=1 Tax=hydrothermal vent metagenome TaxID=652676 RepID=A0A3B0WMX0_9ZZZZ
MIVDNYNYHIKHSKIRSNKKSNTHLMFKDKKQHKQPLKTEICSYIKVKISHITKKITSKLFLKEPYPLTNSIAYIRSYNKGAETTY